MVGYIIAGFAAAILVYLQQRHNGFGRQASTVAALLGGLFWIIVLPLWLFSVLNEDEGRGDDAERESAHQRRRTSSQPQR